MAIPIPINNGLLVAIRQAVAAVCDELATNAPIPPSAEPSPASVSALSGDNDCFSGSAFVSTGTSGSNSGAVAFSGAADATIPGSSVFLLLGRHGLALGLLSYICTIKPHRAYTKGQRELLFIYWLSIFVRITKKMVYSKQTRRESHQPNEQPPVKPPHQN